MPRKASARHAAKQKQAADQLFEVRRSGIQGRGAFALRRIPKGTRIIEYTGERISSREADVRYDDSRMRRHHTFLFVLTSRTVIDAVRGGNASRFINHSCEPSCETMMENKRIYIEAIRNIPAGAELTYDYLYERSSGDDEAEETLYVCHCGAKRCRGTILAPRSKRKRRRRKGREIV